MTDQTTMTMTVGGVTTGPFTADDLEKAVKQIRGGPPMREDSDFKRHNQKAFDVTADELRQFIERYEYLAREKQDIAEHQKEVMAEAKGRGYDTKIIRKIVALRKRQADDIAEEEAIMSMYMAALGMGQ